MNKFTAERFYIIGSLLGNTVQALNVINSPGGSFPDLTPDNMRVWLQNIQVNCTEISLIQSAKCAGRLVDELTVRRDITHDEMRVKLEDFQKLIHSEMEEEKFFWVPSHRAVFYEKDVWSVIGEQCYTRFPKIIREVAEAMKCFAFGRYTACAFHLMRTTEAGVRALGIAIQFQAPNNNWGNVFPEFEKQFNLKPKDRPQWWQTHGDFLELVGADLRAINKAWRNRIAHLDATYGEEEAKHLLAVIPAFMSHIAAKLDEKGNLH